jgi:hypothetical protein
MNNKAYKGKLTAETLEIAHVIEKLDATGKWIALQHIEALLKAYPLHKFRLIKDGKEVKAI